MTIKEKAFGGSPIPGGVPPMIMTINDQQFRVRGSISGLRLLMLIKAMDGSSDDTDSATEMIKFIEFAALTEDRDRLMNYLLESDPPVPLTTLTEIITWLIGEYSGKPIESPEPSSGGLTPTGSGSTVGPFSQESTSPQTNWTPPPSYPSATH
jgi:hypothetical protein